MITLRDYQQAAVDALWAYFERGTEGNPLIVAPTGSGKSAILGEVCRRACAEADDARILLVTHRKELIEQDASAIRRVWPDAPVGIFSAGLGIKQIRQITVAGVQSIHKRARDFGNVDLVLVDEAHLLGFDDGSMYRKLLAGLADSNPRVRVVGLTATPYRLAGGKLTRGRNRLFTSICYDIKIPPLVEAGYLAPLTTPSTAPGYDTSKVTIEGGEFKSSELASSIDAQIEVTRAAIAESLTLLAGRRAVLVFCVSIEHAEATAKILHAAGETAEVIIGDTDPLTRASAITRFRTGQTRWLVGVDVLTTGFDAPITDGIVLLRPTQSTGLYVQIVGRGMRIHDGKTDCLVLDYGGNIERHGPITAVAPKSQKEGAKTLVKECPQCMNEVAMSKRECPECGYIFPPAPRAIDHERTADKRAIMGEAPPPEWAEVDAVSMSPWYKKTAEGEEPKPPTVCVEYRRGSMTVVREWVCPEHKGYAAEKFRAWWFRMGGDMPAPHTVALTIERFEAGELSEVDGVCVGKDGQYQRVMSIRVKKDKPAEVVPDILDEELPF